MFKNYLNRSNAEFDPIGDPLGGDPKFSRIRKFNDPVTAAIAGGASLLGSAISGSAAKSAAQTQADAANQAAQLQQQTALAGIPVLQGAYGQGQQYANQAYGQGTQAVSGEQAGQQNYLNNLYNAQYGDQSNLYQQQYNNLQPYENAGGAAASQLQSLIPQLSQTFNNADLNSQLAPNYQWQLQQGLGATNQAMNIAGGGSNMVNAADIFAQNYAGNAYQNAFNNYQTQQNNIYNRLSGIANIGLTGTGQNIQAGGQYSGALSSMFGTLAPTSTSLTNNSSSNLANLASQYGSQSAGLATGLGNNTVGLTTGAAQAGAGGITGAANANAAGQIGAANSLSSGLSSAGNNYLLSQLLAAKNPASNAQSVPISNAQSFPISNNGLISGTPLD